MGYVKNGRLLAAFVAFILLVSCVEHTLAIRPLEGEKWVEKEKNLKLESLARGKVPSSGASSCTYIPGGKGRCPLNGMNVAGDVAHLHPVRPVFTDVALNSGIASMTISKESQKQDSSS